MRRPWQIWLAFLVCLGIVIPAMSWLSWRVLELDRSNQETRRQAELARDAADLQKRISNALWRIDSALTPLVTLEASRPYSVYPPFSIDDGADTPPVPSPLLMQPSRFVYLHFELGPENRVACPEIPTGDWFQQALDCGVSPNWLDQNRDRGARLEQLVSLETLAAQLPQEAATLDRLLAAGENPDLAIEAFNPQGYVQGESQAGGPVQNGPSQQAAEQWPEEVAQVPGGPQVGSQAQQHAYPGTELQARNQAMANFGNSSLRGRKGPANSVAAPEVREGVSRVFWLNGELFMCRRVADQGGTKLQGCWFNWPELEEAARTIVSDLIPQVEFVPVAAGTVKPIMLATLPIELRVPEPAPPSADTVRWTPAAQSLAMAWAGLALAAVATGVLLRGVLRLSERRASFVSAVTHELRTPLTTFRMYAEMLEQEMVPDPAERKSYLGTLRIEADRLSHLVENVLQYARLERNRLGKRCQTITVGELLGSLETRLRERAAQARMELVVSVPEDVRSQPLQTDPAAVDQILFNLVDNACKYAASAETRRIEIAAERRGTMVVVGLRDFGPGIERQVRRRLFQPFGKPAHEASVAPGVGLGLALCQRLARAIGGRLSLVDSSAHGTRFELRMPTRAMG